MAVILCIFFWQSALPWFLVKQHRRKFCQQLFKLVARHSCSSVEVIVRQCLKLVSVHNGAFSVAVANSRLSQAPILAALHSSIAAIAVACA